MTLAFIGRALGLLLLVLMLAQPARADQTDPRLDDLFAQLQTADSRGEVVTIERQIWHIWLSSGEEGIDMLFLHGGRAMQARALGRARNMFDQIIALRPDVAEGWNKRATVLYLMGDYPASIRDIDEVLAREPRHFGALFGLGLCHLELGDQIQAMAAFERALRVHPHIEGVQMHLKRLREALGGHQI